MTAFYNFNSNNAVAQTCSYSLSNSGLFNKNKKKKK